MTGRTRYLLVALGLGLAIVVGWHAVAYVVTDSAYDRLAAAEPETRAEVGRILGDFAEYEISDPSRMQPILRDKLDQGMHYLAFERFRGFQIHVLVDEQGQVLAVWPAYE